MSLRRKISYNAVIPEVVIGNPFFCKNLDTRLRGYDREGLQCGNGGRSRWLPDYRPVESPRRNNFGLDGKSIFMDSCL